MTNVDEEVLKKHGAKLSRIKERLNFHLKGSKKKKQKTLPKIVGLLKAKYDKCG